MIRASKEAHYASRKKKKKKIGKFIIKESDEEETIVQPVPKKANGTPKVVSKRTRRETAPTFEPTAKRVRSANRPIRSLADAVVELLKTTRAQRMERYKHIRKATAESTPEVDFIFVEETGPTTENVTSRYFCYCVAC